MTSLRLAVFALVVGVATTASAQILDIEINNGVFYVYDTTDLSTFATSPAVVPPWSGGPSPGISSAECSSPISFP